MLKYLLILSIQVYCIRGNCESNSDCHRTVPVCCRKGNIRFGCQTRAKCDNFKQHSVVELQEMFGRHSQHLPMMQFHPDASKNRPLQFHSEIAMALEHVNKQSDESTRRDHQTCLDSLNVLLSEHPQVNITWDYNQYILFVLLYPLNNYRLIANY